MARRGGRFSPVFSPAGGRKGQRADVRVGPAPVNETPPAIAGDKVEGGTLTFVPGVYDVEVTSRFRVLRGDASGPISPAAVLLDWTAEGAGVVPDVEPGDWLWLQEEARGPNGRKIVVTAWPGFGPMEAAAVVAAAVIAAGEQNTVGATVQTVYSDLSLNIPDDPDRCAVLVLQSQGAPGGAENPTWDNVTLGGVALAFVKAEYFQDSTRAVWTEVWALAGGLVPAGPAVQVSARRSETTNSMRQLITCAVVGGVTGAPGAGDVAQQGNPANGTTYGFDVTTSEAGRFVLAFAAGLFANAAVIDDAFTATGSGWDIDLMPWANGRSLNAIGWSALLSRTIPVASAVGVGWSRTSSNGHEQHYGVLTTVQLSGGGA